MTEQGVLHIVTTAGLIYGVNEKRPILTLCGDEIIRTPGDFPVDTSRPVCPACEERSDGSEKSRPLMDAANFANVRTYSLGATRAFRWGYEGSA